MNACRLKAGSSAASSLTCAVSNREIRYSPVVFTTLSRTISAAIKRRYLLPRTSWKPPDEDMRGCGVWLRRSSRRLIQQVEEHAGGQQQRRNLQDALRMHAETEQPRRHQRPERRPGGHADHDDREQPIAGLLGVDVVGERPELRDQRHVEDADPDEEGDADIRHAGRHRRREQLDARDEEQRHAHQQPGAVDARREPAVERNESHQQQRLAGRGVRPHFGAAAEQNQRFANRLDDGIADQQDEYVDQHQHRRGAFTGADVGEQRQRTVQQRFLSDGGFRERRVRALRISSAP